MAIGLGKDCGSGIAAGWAASPTAVMSKTNVDVKMANRGIFKMGARFQLNDWDL